MLRCPTIATLSAWTAAGLLALPVGVATAAPVTYGPGIGGAIPDNNVSGFTSSISVTDAFTVASFTRLTITGFTHSWVGDLLVTLSHNGVLVDILDRVRGTPSGASGTDSSNLNGTYTFELGGADFDAAAIATLGTEAIPPGAYAPHAGGSMTVNDPGGSSASTQTLADFSGLNVNGSWTLNISDRVRLDSGSFTGWSFTVDDGRSPAAVDEPSSLALVLLAAGAAGGLAKRRRSAGVRSL